MKQVSLYDVCVSDCRELAKTERSEADPFARSQQGGDANNRKDDGGNAVHQPDRHALGNALADEDSRYIGNHHAQRGAGNNRK